MTDGSEETPAEALDRYLAEAERKRPARKQQKRWDRSTIILGIVEAAISAAALIWWLLWRS